jgi:hypothetical protein
MFLVPIFDYNATNEHPKSDLTINGKLFPKLVKNKNHFLIISHI